MITLYLNCAKVWTHLVRGVCRLTRRRQVTYEAPSLPAKISGTALEPRGAKR